MPHQQDEPVVNDEALISPEEAAALLGLVDDDGKPRPRAIYELARTRARDPLPAFRVGKYLRLRRSELLEWTERQRVRPRQPTSRFPSSKTNASGGVAH